MHVDTTVSVRSTGSRGPDYVSLRTRTIKKLKPDKFYMGNPISELRGVTCHLGSPLPPDTSELTPP